jgi:hypothetical protein
LIDIVILVASIVSSPINIFIAFLLLLLGFVNDQL